MQWIKEAGGSLFRVSPLGRAWEMLDASQAEFLNLRMLSHELSERLRQIGVEAAPLEEESPENIRTPLTIGHAQSHVACVKVKGRSINLIQLEALIYIYGDD